MALRGHVGHGPLDRPVAPLVLAHESLLLRDLSPEEMPLQHGKVVNLRRAAPRLDGLLVRPGETLSVNKVLGPRTRRRGYTEGMELLYGDVTPGVGGGICQLANWLHWVVLHSPMTVVERSEHTYDPFPDKDRVLPWGVGASLHYNYVDLVLRNDTETTFQLLLRVGPTHLEGELRADRALLHRYEIRAVAEGFWRYQGEVFRRNEIRRRVIDARTGESVGDEHVKDNLAIVRYQPDPSRIVDA